MILDDIRVFLIAQGIGGPSTTWPVYEGYFPDDAGKDQQIGLFETGGYPQDTLGRENVRPTFQTRIRAARLDYETGRTKWRDVFVALQDSTPAVGYAYVQAMTSGPLVFNDDKGRPNFITNWRVLKSRD